MNPIKCSIWLTGNKKSTQLNILSSIDRRDKPISVNDGTTLKESIELSPEGFNNDLISKVTDIVATHIGQLLKNEKLLTKDLGIDYDYQKSQFDKYRVRFDSFNLFYQKLSNLIERKSTKNDEWRELINGMTEDVAKIDHFLKIRSLLEKDHHGN